MSQRFTAPLLIVSILIFLILFAGTFFAESIPYIGIYEFFSSFGQLVERTWKALLLGSLVFSLIRPLIYEGNFLAGLSGPGVRPWFFALILGVLEKPFFFGVVSRMASFYRSGIHMGAILVYTLSSVLLSTPFLVFLVVVLPSDFVNWYILLSFIFLVFSGALGELLSGFKFISSPIITRKNPEKFLSFFSTSYIRKLRLKGYISLFFGKFSEFWKYVFPSWFFGICLVSLVQAAFPADLLRIFLGDHFLGQVGVFVLSGVLPFYGFAGLVFGLHFVDVYSGLGTLMALLVSSFFWKCILEGLPRKLYLRSWKISFLLIIFIGLFVVGYIGNLLA